MSNSLSTMLTLGEIVRLASKVADPDAWDYLIGGSETETTLRRNRRALDELAFRPRVLRNVSTIDTSHEVLGIAMRLPLFLAPMGSIKSLDKSGAVATAIAAKEFGVAAFVSSSSHPGMQTTMHDGGGDLIFQLYVRGDGNSVMEQLTEATDLGYKAFCLTVDSAMYGRRERDKLRGYTPEARIDVTGINHQSALDWNLVNKIRSKSTIPLILKGIATEEDARMAVEHEIDVIYVSNHGGRQLDFGRGTLDILPEIIATVDGKARVFVDGAICRGTDILKAMCLGADAVGIGRLCGYGLAAGGKDGIVKVLELLEEEIINAMANLGVTGLDQLTPELVCRAPSVHEPSVFSAFHLVDIPGTKY